MHRVSACKEFVRQQSEYLDGRLPGEVRARLDVHLDSCPKCRERNRSLDRVHRTVRSLPAKAVPPTLTTRLQIVASREIARRNKGLTWWGEQRERVSLLFENLMRPFALPAAGGFVSAVLLFGTIAPFLALPGASAYPLDVPTAFYTDPSVKGFLPVGTNPGEIEVEVTIDDQGRMIDYSLPESQRESLAKSPHLQRSLENKLLFTIFEPAKMLGQSVTGGRIRLSVSTSTIDVKG